MDKKKVILDVDTGSDDAIAIILAVLHPDLDVLGITTVNGNKPLPNTTENTLRVKIPWKYYWNFLMCPDGTLFLPEVL